MFFNFNEANILKQNLFSPQDNKQSLLSRLITLENNTSETYLKQSILSLTQKIEALSEQQVIDLRNDILNKNFIITYCIYM